MRSKAWKLLVILVTAGLATPALTTSATATSSQSLGAARSNPAVITHWNTIAARTIFTENATPIPSSALYFGFVSLAVFDAVNAIEGGCANPRSAARPPPKRRPRQRRTGC